MFLKQTPKKMPGNRVSIEKNKTLLANTKTPRFLLGRRTLAGRGLNGQKTVLSKARYKIKSFFPKKCLFPSVYSLGLLTKVIFKQYNKLAMGVYLTCEGLWYLKPVTKEDAFCSFNQTAPSTWAATFGLKPLAHWPAQLKWLFPGALVSFLPLKVSSSPKIACAPGSTCQLLAPEVWTYWALCRLPSGQLKFFNKKITGIPSKLEPMGLKHVFSSKAGFNVLHGRRPTVRGVVKNTCDHPNGGKGRAPKCPRTPWGRVARRPRLKKTLRSLP